MISPVYMLIQHYRDHNLKEFVFSIYFKSLILRNNISGEFPKRYTIHSFGKSGFDHWAKQKPPAVTLDLTGSMFMDMSLALCSWTTLKDVAENSLKREFVGGVIFSRFITLSPNVFLISTQGEILSIFWRLEKSKTEKKFS
jgi:hypothetical protein